MCKNVQQWTTKFNTNIQTANMNTMIIQTATNKQLLHLIYIQISSFIRYGWYACHSKHAWLFIVMNIGMQYELSEAHGQQRQTDRLTHEVNVKGIASKTVLRLEGEISTGRQIGVEWLQQWINCASTLHMMHEWSGKLTLPATNDCAHPHPLLSLANVCSTTSMLLSSIDSCQKVAKPV